MLNAGLVDIRDVNINIGDTLNERALSFTNQIKDPYNFRYGKYKVSVGFVGTQKLEDKIISLISKK